MLCPHCNQEELEVRYTHTLTPVTLDSGQPPRMVWELSGFVCHRCQLLWYAMHRETLQAAYERICKEELHP